MFWTDTRFVDPYYAFASELSWDKKNHFNEKAKEKPI